MQRKVTKLRKGNTIMEVKEMAETLENLEMQITNLTSIDNQCEASKKEPKALHSKKQKKHWNSEKAEKIAWILMAIATALNTISIIIRIVKMQS